MKRLIYLLSLVPFFVVAADVHIDILGIKAGKGQIVVSVWDSEDNYLKTPFLIKTIAASNIRNKQLRFTFSSSLPAECAISVYYDENANGKLDTNWLGIPREAVGISNNVKGRFGPPKYNDGKITLSGNEQIFKIYLEEI
ncbi:MULTISPECIES: DUF2141 domain-containing protein [unclassified Agarivorans]|uniref:DUF2141 domain-containing protein n=1 Tax=unclassified Agarivorans TaxID=2636026 RepID=UPI0026E4036D|nr:MULTISPECIES: DUF2141 domain-containing protein [unclassified Agarivorans]MDO6685761.1 DUF2141 domain-containing protein [Agarivorans sp. 3_MG-2023]MDO6716124.1 DUF2141 domain-containing protein [Agarivorans sp. 2_MG-2023]